MSNLTIADDVYKRILTCMGYPVIQETDLGISADDIKDLLILPVLRYKYFKWFPKTEGYQVAVSSDFEIDFPDVNTFGVVDIRLVKQGTGSGRTDSPLLNDINIKVSGSSGMNMWNTGNDYNFSSVYFSKMLTNQALIDYSKSLRKHVDYTNKKITGYSNISGNLFITWAKYSDDFGDVIFKYQEDVEKLSQANVMRFFGQLFNQSNQTVPDSIDGGDLISRADDIEDEIMEKWKQFTKVVLIRD